MKNFGLKSTKMFMFYTVYYYVVFKTLSNTLFYLSEHIWVKQSSCDCSHITNKDYRYKVWEMLRNGDTERTFDYHPLCI